MTTYDMVRRLVRVQVVPAVKVAVEEGDECVVPAHELDEAGDVVLGLGYYVHPP